MKRRKKKKEREKGRKEGRKKERTASNTLSGDSFPWVVALMAFFFRLSIQGLCSKHLWKTEIIPPFGSEMAYLVSGLINTMSL
jgi:hypothetical protein